MEIISASDTKTCKPELPSPYKPFSFIIVGSVIRKNVSTSEPLDQDIVPILDNSKSLAEYIFQVDFVAHPYLVYSNNEIKAAPAGGDFSIQQLISLPIVHTNIFGRWY